MALEFSNDPFELVADGSAFAADYLGWAEDLYDSRCFRVRGAYDLVDALNFKRTDVQHNRALARDFVDSIPPNWQKTYAPEQGQAWGKYGLPQVGAVMSSEPQIFDRALMSVVYLVRFLENQGRAVSKEHLTMLRIYPVLYTLNVANPEFFNEHVRDKPLLAQLQEAVRAQTSDLVRQAFVQRKCMTKANAERLQQILANGPAPHCTIQVSRGRRPVVASNKEELLPAVSSTLTDARAATN